MNNFVLNSATGGLGAVARQWLDAPKKLTEAGSVADVDVLMGRVEVPDHQLVRMIGRGAYGEVWLARNAIGTCRAVKIVFRTQFEDDQPYEREFKGIQKFEPISRSHEGLVDLLQVGRDDRAGYFYYIMELADSASPLLVGANGGSKPAARGGDSDGQKHPLCSVEGIRAYSPRTLRAELLARGRLPAAECITLCLQLTSALEHLHGNGLVHRDIKPSNIIFVNCVPKLADIGLVADLSEAKSFVGTPGYIPPEGPGTQRADLYSLGKVLYEMATGKDRQRFPQLPANLRENARTDGLIELNEIVLKACEADPARRYQSAGEMASDLNLLKRGGSLKRQQRRQRIVGGVKAFAVGFALLILLSAAVYRIKPSQTPQPAVDWSRNEAAIEAYRMGITVFHENSQGSFERASKYFRRAIELDPKFARAYARLARAITWSGPDLEENLEKARPYAYRALMLNEKSDEAHCAVASIKTLLEHDWAGADKHHLQAIRLNSKSEDNLYTYASFLTIVGRKTEAVRQVEKAMEMDSRSFVWMQNAAFVFVGSRQYDRAIQIVDDIIREQPSRGEYLTRRFLIPAYLWKGDYLKAIDLAEATDPGRTEKATAVRADYNSLRTAYAQNGSVGYWRRVLELEKASATPLRLSVLLARAGEKRAALEELQETLRTMPIQLAFQINFDPGFDNLRQEPEFEQILRTLGLDKIRGAEAGAL